MTFVPLQMELEEAEILTAGVTTGLTIMLTWFEVTLGAVGQASDEVMIHSTISPFNKEELV